MRIEAAARAAGMSDAMQVLTGQSHTALAACDVTLIASGTATLEAALFKRPMVIAYRMGALSWQIMRRKQLQPWVGLPNILCRDFVVPELLQDAATPQALANEVLRWLDAITHEPEKMRALEQRFLTLHLDLQRDTPKLAAHAIAQVLQSPVR
jgi:lipid-A-disaccharide synthase